MEQKRTLSLLVDNTPGLLSRVAGLFSRRGYNIETITAGVTADPRYTRMTVVLYCSDEMILEQIKKQLAKLVDVRDIKELKPDESVRRELMLVKIRVNENERRNVIAISDVFRGRIVDVGQADCRADRKPVKARRVPESGTGIRNPGTGQNRSDRTLQRSPRCALPRLTQITLHTFARGMKFLYRKVHFPDKQQKAEMLFAV